MQRIKKRPTKHSITSLIQSNVWNWPSIIVLLLDVNIGEHPAAIHGDNGCSLLPQPGLLLVLITSLLLLLSRHWWCFHILNRPATLQWITLPLHFSAYSHPSHLITNFSSVLDAESMRLWSLLIGRRIKTTIITIATTMKEARRTWLRPYHHRIIYEHSVSVRMTLRQQPYCAKLEIVNQLLKQRTMSVSWCVFRCICMYIYTRCMYTRF